MSSAIGSGADAATENTVIGLLKRAVGLGGGSAVTSPAASEVAPADQASVDAYAPVAGSTVDTFGRSGRSVGFALKEQGGANGVTFEVSGSIDGSAWTPLTTLDEAGAERGGVDIAVAAGATALAFVTPEYDAGAKAGFRYYRVQVKATVGGSQGSARVRGFAK